MTQELLSRQIAIDVFSAVLRKNQGLEEEFNRAMEQQKQPLAPRDRTFVRLLVATMFRRLGQIDDILKHFIKKPLSDKAFYVTDVLRLGTAQSVFLETPAHAVVSTAVDLVKKSDFTGFSSLVNAIMRRVCEQGTAIVKQQNAALLNTPDWLMKEWKKEYGKEKACKIALSSLTEAPLDFSVKNTPEKWAAALNAELMTTGTLRRSESALVPSLPGFDEGQWWIQDLSAALPVKLFSDLNGKKAIDLCAAPGGKTAQMLARGADVTALDTSVSRVRRLKENLRRLNYTTKTVTADARLWWEKHQNDGLAFDAVLLDAPCSATGTLRRHPDVARHRTPQDIERLNKTQRELLATAIEMTAAGGELIYCVCSVLPQEGRLIVDQAIKAGKVECLPISSREMPAEMITDQGYLLVLPFMYEEKGGCDGFFAARLRKKDIKS